MDFELDLDLKSNFLSDFGLDLDLKSNSELDLDLDLDFGAWTLVWTWTWTLVWTSARAGKHCGPAALGLSGARRQLGGGRPRGGGRGRSARGARPPGRGPGYAQALDEILPTNKSDLCQLAATQTAGLVVGNLRSSACAALRAARVAMMALIISFACHTVWH